MRTLAGNHKLPANPTWIEFHNTDGDESRLPRNTEEIVDSEGHVNFMRPCPVDESVTISWRKLIGMEVARRLNYPPGPFYVVKEWPKGYQLYDHHKGPQESPRHDPYLYGSINVGKFRSPAEFIPHAIWLLSSQQGNDALCECKYCSKRPQRAISLEMGLSPVRPSEKITQHPSRRPKGKRRTLASIRRVPPTITYALLKGPTQFVLPTRDKDLRAVVGYKGVGVNGKRWAREGELVWCALDRPIKCSSSVTTVSERNAILFWPGLIQEIRLRSEPQEKIPQQNTSNMDIIMTDSNDPDNLGTTDLQSEEHVGNTANGEKEGVDDVPWIIVQTTNYKIKLLAVDSDCLVPDTGLIPYQAYAPPDELLLEMKQIKIPVEDGIFENDDGEGGSNMISILRNRFSQFKPMPYEGMDIDEGSDRFLQAAGPFALAIQIASRLADYWTPTDDWKHKIPIPSPPPARSNGSAQLNPLLRDISGTSRKPLSQEELQSLNNRVMGLRNREKENVIVETRFQGLWWGAERIWMDDMVRLKVGRHQVAPEGSQFVKKPSGLINNNGQSNEENDLGAAGRGLFIQIEGIFIVDVLAPDGLGTRKEGRMCGMLYELADEDWVDPEENATAASDVKGSEIIDLPSSSPKNAEISHMANPIPLTKTASIITQTLPSALTPPVTSVSSMLASSSSGPFTLPSVPQTPSKPTILSSPDNPNISLNRTIFQASSQQSHADANVSIGFANSSIKKRSLAGPPPYGPYPLPIPPKGYKFHPILPPSHEAVLALELISGRYYPRILENPLLLDKVTQAIQSGQYSQSSPLWALECLTPGVHNAVDPHKWKSSRLAMTKEADATASSEILEFWIRKSAQSAQEVDATEHTTQMAVEEVL